MHTRYARYFLALCPAVLVFGACTAAPTTSTVAGAIDQASFPAPVNAVTVVSSGGAHVRTAVDSSGRFKAVLTPGETYTLFAGDDGASIPIAVRSDLAVLGGSIGVRSAGAAVDLGTIQYFDPLTHSQAKPLAHRVNSGAQPTFTPMGRDVCVSGFKSISGLPCATTSAQIECADDDDDDEHCDEHDGDEDGGHDEHACEDGIDANGAPCDGGPSANEAGDGDGEVDDDQPTAEIAPVDTTHAFAFSSLNLEGAIQCKEHEHEHGDGDGEEDDD